MILQAAWGVITLGMERRACLDVCVLLKKRSIVFPVILLDGDGPVFVSLMVKMPKSPNYRLV